MRVRCRKKPSNIKERGTKPWPTHILLHNSRRPLLAPPLPSVPARFGYPLPLLSARYTMKNQQSAPSRLSGILKHLRGSEAPSPGLTNGQTRADKMRIMAERFSPRLPTHPYPPPYTFPSTSSRLDAAQSPLGPGAVVLLTGSTGALGSYLLSSLAENPDVSRVYALNRGSDQSSLLERQRSTLDCRGLDCSILGEGKVVIIHNGAFLCLLRVGVLWRFRQRDI